MVAIGRNEGARLERCLASALAATKLVVYVDSGSSDQQRGTGPAHGRGDGGVGCGPAVHGGAGRNAGFEKLAAMAPQVQWVQFVDGDCELDQGWLELAMKSIAQYPQAGVLCGRRRERFPQASVYNRLCDVEWDTPVGEATWCGGDSLVRAAAFVQAGQFNAAMIAGEEPEFCFRLQSHGWKIIRIDAEMTLHDAAMTRFGQWWKRAVRCGHAFAHGAFLHGDSPQRVLHSGNAQRLVLGRHLAGIGTGVGVADAGLEFGPAAGVSAQSGAAFHRRFRRGLKSKLAWQYAWFGLLGKFAQALGQTQFQLRRALGRASRIIEYKQ